MYGTSVALCQNLSHCEECVTSCFWTADELGRCSCHVSLDSAGADLTGFLRPGSVCDEFKEVFCHHRKIGTAPITIPSSAHPDGGVLTLTIISLVCGLVMMVAAILVWLFPQKSDSVRQFLLRNLHQCRMGISRRFGGGDVPSPPTPPSCRERPAKSQVQMFVPPPPTPPPPPPLASPPTRPRRSRKSKQEPAFVLVPPVLNPPDFQVDQALEQQRQILLRFRGFQTDLDGLNARMAWAQNRLLELKVIQERRRKALDHRLDELEKQILPPPSREQAPGQPTLPVQPPLLQQAPLHLATLPQTSLQPSSPSPALHPQPLLPPPPPLQQAPLYPIQSRTLPLQLPSLQPCPQFQPPASPGEQQEFTITDDEDEDGEEDGRPRVPPIRDAKKRNPCYMRETVAFAGKKTHKK
ncbi:unnamed protein product [Allacma fusca]|uniref:Uncharacterized protein n=1 Tax=Allacma fusca TaxID=39272 RepID=A0A8J2P1Y3_9HEXA|nr:unnamed protein product [Allacma fusca]